MKMTKHLIALSIMLASSSAYAWQSEDGQHSTSASVELSSDYVWRGYSQTDNEPALSGSFDYQHTSGLYAGAWASNVDFEINNDQAHIEMDVYAGFAGEISDTGISYDLGVLRYIYPGTDSGNWNEIYASMSYSFFSLGVAHSDDVYNSNDRGTYYSLGFEYPTLAGINFETTFGYYDYDRDVFGRGNADSAKDMKVGINKDLAGFNISLNYINSDGDAGEIYGDSITDGRVVFAISKSM
jgi:uncharacterized protein (TIGR02001 family)